MRRAIDVLAAATGLVVLAPLFIVLAAWIRRDSAGPVFFRQERVGRYGKVFRIHKFRTMTEDASTRGPQLTVGQDARITRAGRIMRRYKLDELPQLFDVLLGHMSLVGPRPEVPRYVAHYPPDVRALVLSVRPGITDPGSLEYFDEAETLAATPDPEHEYIHNILPRKLRIYSGYVRSRTLHGDLLVVLRTLARICRVRGSGVPNSSGSV